MNEASSKYVDNIATEKLINEKLKHVHHFTENLESESDSDFVNISSIKTYPKEVIETQDQNKVAISFPSILETKYPENNTVKCQLFPAKDPKGNIVFVHGLYEDNLQIYNFFITMLNEQGCNVYLMMLPFHYARKPAESAFSGEYFWSGDVNRSALAFKQSVYDLYQLYNIVRDKSQQIVWIVGFSMGGGISLKLASLIQLDGVFAVNPVCNIAELIWNSQLFLTVKQDLEMNGFQVEYIKKQYDQYEPLHVKEIKTPLENVVIAKGLYDQINDPENYNLLENKWRFKHVISYKSGHLNILRVPKLAPDVAHFYFKR